MARVRFVSFPHDGPKIDGIRALREATGLGLKESKDMIEDLMRGVSFTADILEGKDGAVEVFRKFGGIATYSHTELIGKIIDLAQKALEVHEFDLSVDLISLIKKHTAR